MSDPLDLIDFHRNCFTIVTDNSGEHKTFLIPYGKEKKTRLFCSCTKKSYAQCENAKILNSVYQEHFTDHQPTRDFENSIFWSLIEPVTKTRTDSVYSIKINESERQVKVFDRHGKEILHYLSQKSDYKRLISRISGSPLSRFSLMNRAAEFVLTDQEKALLAAGHKTQRQIVEESIWYRVAYHCYREYSGIDIVIQPQVEEVTGKFSLNMFIGSEKLLSVEIPVESVPLILQVLQKNSMLSSMDVDKEETELCFRLWKSKDVVNITPVVRLCQKRLIDVKPEFIHGSYLYIPEFKRYLFFSYSSLKLIANGMSKGVEIEADEASTYLENNEAIFSYENGSGNEQSTEPSLFGDTAANGFGRIIEPLIIQSFDRIQLNPLSMEKTDCVLDVSYCCGDIVVPLSGIIEHKRKRNRFVFTDKVIIDLESEPISRSIVMARGSKDGKITLSRAALLQFRGTSLTTRIEGDQGLVSQVRQMLEFKSVKALQPINGLKCTLREYQKLAVQWMLFLYDNRFGGLLCDDMGLGKTIQIIALFLAVKEQRKSKDAFMVICPTSVISHWKKLLDSFSPSLRVIVYHTSERESLLKESFDVLLTSYGIMRNDTEKLQKWMFDIVVFDEAHQLKNKETLCFQAAVELNANIKIGVTGTPIENRISDLKSLFDLVLPGLFNKGNYQDEQFLHSLEEGQGQKENLKKLISPFIMRRLKGTVLKELPSKIEDIRNCSLSGEQYEIYTTAVKERGGPLIEQLRDNDKAVPYMHIFTLISFLKQVCNHPALAAGKPQNYEKYQSGKWDLFTELLDETLESGQKLVVFSQFVTMVEIIELYLQKKGVGHVVLTGSSRNRDRIIKQFAEDENCRVFVGSLKAGGVGIDLVSASVLIHYDRWWNPAREDQATDRVHRIGQKRGVQVFKLVTEGTIEQRIHSIIEGKRHLSEEVLTEDSPDSIKKFSRDELIRLLSY